MADFIIWVQISWALERAWFASWPGWLQVAGVLVAAYGLLWLAVVAIMRVAHRPGLTLAEVQEQRESDEWDVAAIIEGIEVYLRAEREMSE